MADQDEWSTNANEALSISFVQAGPDSPVTLSTFHPKFTYPIFGEEECIFGYQGLKISIRFAAHDLLPNVTYTFDKQFKAVNETRALDIQETLQEWLPEGSFQEYASFQSHLQEDEAARDWKPPGELIHSYKNRGRDFEIWAGELTDPAVQQLIDRIQILVSLLIEGGTPIPLKDEPHWSLARWRMFFLYEKLSALPSPKTAPYSLVGYSTTYKFIPHLPLSASTTQEQTPHTFTLSPSTPFSPSTHLPSRARISQFLILPPHQSHSHGTHLYSTLARTFLVSPHVAEITVEDPNEAFDDLRDYCDYARLTANGTFARIRLARDLDPKLFRKTPGMRVPTAQLLHILPSPDPNPDISNDLPALRKQNKIAPRQFARLVEMYLLSALPASVRQSGTARLTRGARSADASDRQWYYWRLLVKQRIYKRNRDVLMQLDRAERVEKVEDALGEQVGDYERLLRRMGERRGKDPGDVNGKGQGKKEKEKGKKKEGEKGLEKGKGKSMEMVDAAVREMVMEEQAAEGVRRRAERRERGKRKVLPDEDEEELEGTPEPKKVKDRAGG